VGLARDQATRGEVGTARRSLSETLMAIVL
jgi:hypothetical protein